MSTNVNQIPLLLKQKNQRLQILIRQLQIQGVGGMQMHPSEFSPKGGGKLKKNLWRWLPTAYANVDHEVLHIDVHTDVYVIVLDCRWSKSKVQCQCCSITSVQSVQRLYSKRGEV